MSEASAGPAPPAVPPSVRHPEPDRTLSPHARTQWTIEALLWAVPLLVAALAAGAFWDAPAWARGLVVAAALVVAVFALVLIPQLRWRRWRYAVRAEEVDLRRGTITVVRTIVPMARIQHVETRRTFLSQMFSTAALVLHTAAGAVAIPALDEPVAAELRDRIAELARTPDDDDLAA